MSGWVMTFLFVSVVAALFGFSGLNTGDAGFARVLFLMFVVFLGISVVAWLTTGRWPPRA